MIDHAHRIPWLSRSTAGTGDMLVACLHCSASSKAQWRPIQSALAHRARVLAVDLVGYGESEGWPAVPSFDLGVEAAGVRAVLPDLWTHLVGHSYGGAVALRMAREEPFRIRSLFLHEPVAFHLLREGEAADRRLFAAIEGLADSLRMHIARGAMDAGMGVFIDFWNGPGAWERMSLERRSALAVKLPKVALDFQAILNDPAIPASFRVVNVPTTITYGESSPEVTRRIARILADAIPNARLISLAGAGHMLPLHDPGRVTALVTEHLDRAGHTAPRLAA